MLVVAKMGEGDSRFRIGFTGSMFAFFFVNRCYPVPRMVHLVFFVQTVALSLRGGEAHSIGRAMQHAILTPQKEHSLAQLASRGDDASRDALVQHNQRLVAYVAESLRNRGIPYEDLIQEGNYGLVLAIARFDPDRGTRLSTYATHYI